jgi:hypothetical protein
LDEEERRKAEQARLAKEEMVLRPELHPPDRSKGDIAEVPHTPYIATTTDYSFGKTDLNLPQQDKALSFHQQATHSALKFALEPQKEAMYNRRPDNTYEEGLIIWDNRQGHYVIQLAANQVKLERHSSFGALLPGPYRFNYLAEKGILLSEEPMPNAPLVASYLSVIPGATHEEQALQLHQKAFCDIFEFSLNDLADNRQGLLSDKQLQRLINKNTNSVWKTVAIVFFLDLPIIVLGFMALLFPRLPLWGGTMLYPWQPLLILLCTLVIIPFVRQSSKDRSAFAASLSQKRVEYIEGKIRERVETVSVDEHIVGRDYYYDIGSLSFQVSPEACDALVSTIRYRLYYLPTLSVIVSIEPLEVPKR